MLENTKVEPARTLPPAALRQEEAGAPGIDELVGRLQALHIEPRLLQSARGVTAGGVALRIPVRKTLQSSLAMDRLMRHLTVLLRDNVPLTVPPATSAPTTRPSIHSRISVPLFAERCLRRACRPIRWESPCSRI